MKTITREQAIARLRKALLELVDEEHSICEVVSRLGIYCKGFSQWSFDDLKQRYDWIVERRPGISREELEHIANIWQLARNEVHGTPTACDTQDIEHDTCMGWGEWSDEELAHFLGEATGEQVAIAAESLN
jgi:hypothetical protein